MGPQFPSAAWLRAACGDEAWTKLSDGCWLVVVTNSSCPRCKEESDKIIGYLRRVAKHACGVAVVDIGGAPVLLPPDIEWFPARAGAYRTTPADRLPVLLHVHDGSIAMLNPGGRWRAARGPPGRRRYRSELRH